MSVHPSVCPSHSEHAECAGCVSEREKRRVAFRCRAKGWRNAPAIRGNVLSRAPAKRVIEKINNTLRIEFGAKARLVKCKEGKKWEGRCFVVVPF